MVTKSLVNGLIQCSCILSMIGAALVIFTWGFPKSNRRKHGRILLLWLSVADLLASIFYFLQTFPSNQNANICETFGLIDIFFPVASFLWTDFIAYYLYLVVKNRSQSYPFDWKKLLFSFHCIAWGTALLTMLLVVLNGHAGRGNISNPGDDDDAFSNTAGWCWVNGPDPESRFVWELIGGKLIEWISGLVIVPYLYSTVAYQLFQIDRRQVKYAGSSPSAGSSQQLNNSNHAANARAKAGIGYPSSIRGYYGSHQQQHQQQHAMQHPSHFSSSSSRPQHQQGMIHKSESATNLSLGGIDSTIQGDDVLSSLEDGLNNNGEEEEQERKDDQLPGQIQRTSNQQQQNQQQQDDYYHENYIDQDDEEDEEDDYDTYYRYNTYNPQHSNKPTAISNTNATIIADNGQQSAADSLSNLSSQNSRHALLAVTSAPTLAVPAMPSSPTTLLRILPKNHTTTTATTTRKTVEEQEEDDDEFDLRLPAAPAPRLPHDVSGYDNERHSSTTSEGGGVGAAAGHRDRAASSKAGKSTHHVNNNNANNNRFFNRFYFKLLVLPLVFILIRFWSSLRILLSFNGHKDIANDNFLVIMQAFFDPSQGFFNAILFVFFNSEDRRRLYFTLGQCYCQIKRSCCSSSSGGSQNRNSSLSRWYSNSSSSTNQQQQGEGVGGEAGGGGGDRYINGATMNSDAPNSSIDGYDNRAANSNSVFSNFYHYYRQRWLAYYYRRNATSAANTAADGVASGGGASIGGGEGNHSSGSAAIRHGSMSNAIGLTSNLGETLLINNYNLRSPPVRSSITNSATPAPVPAPGTAISINKSPMHPAAQPPSSAITTTTATAGGVAATQAAAAAAAGYPRSSSQSSSSCIDVKDLEEDFECGSEDLNRLSDFSFDSRMDSFASPAAAAAHQAQLHQLQQHHQQHLQQQR